MDDYKLLITGETPLTGDTTVSGGKNTAVAVIPAVLRQQRGARQERQHHTCKQGSEASESRFLSHIFSFYPLISATVCAKLVTLAEINKQIGNVFILLYSEPVKTPMKVATRKNENGVGGT